MTVGGAATTTQIEQQQQQQKHLLSSTITTTTQQYNSYSKHHHHPHHPRDNSMLTTHPRLPVHMEYLQPHLNGVPETKASPLALLAATCSSIGKTDAEKKDIRTTTTTPVILSKLSPSQETKQTSSPFQPYKRDERSHSRSPIHDKSSKHIMRSSPPILVSNTNIVSSKVVSSIGTSNPKHFRVNSSPGIREKSNSDREFDDYRKYHHRLSKDKGFKECNMPSSLPPLPHKIAMLPLAPHNHPDCSQCKPGRPHASLIPNAPRPRSSGPHMCSCPMCNNRPADPKCHFQNAPPSGIYHSPHKQASLPPPPVITSCRDPNCTNCSKVHSSKTLQNFVHPALAQQCTHNSPPLKSHYVPPPSSSVSSYDPYYHPNGASLPPKPKANVCNWVSDGKHCGNSFVTSEELYQHLRTHTSLQQQRNNENSDALSPGHPINIPSHAPHGGCTIHGCPCSNGQRKTSPRSGVIPGYSYNPSGPPSSIRYAPYGRPVSAGGHSYPPHMYPY